MNRDEVKKIVYENLQQGLSLSDIQKVLHDKGEIITFLDLRLLASELENLDWKKLAGEKDVPPPETKKKEETADKADKTEPEGEEDVISGDKGEWSGGTKIEISKITRPGVALSGSATFASGVKADWFVDQMGRLGLEKATGKPTPEDVKGFQEELQKQLQGM
ncbi:MAG TPA: hypothetical protein DET40_05580 [Lentisphaeria bacterium]|nr:MAG: hypothetical protein A2X45_12320 [Lentisphaerae bacterium GWF2_50_93]HCE42997.1 hypothetical protein [Lentisphaeria bacterium]